jgi:hypothetical protein
VVVRCCCSGVRNRVDWLYGPHSSNIFVLFYVLFVFVSLCVLFLCKGVLSYCHRVATQLQLRNISYICRLFGEASFFHLEFSPRRVSRIGYVIGPFGTSGRGDFLNELATFFSWAALKMEVASSSEASVTTCQHSVIFQETDHQNMVVWTSGHASGNSAVQVLWVRMFQHVLQHVTEVDTKSYFDDINVLQYETV